MRRSGDLDRVSPWRFRAVLSLGFGRGVGPHARATLGNATLAVSRGLLRTTDGSVVVSAGPQLVGVVSPAMVERPVLLGVVPERGRCDRCLTGDFEGVAFPRVSSWVRLRRSPHACRVCLGPVRGLNPLRRSFYPLRRVSSALSTGTDPACLRAGFWGWEGRRQNPESTPLKC